MVGALPVDFVPSLTTCCPFATDFCCARGPHGVHLQDHLCTDDRGFSDDKIKAIVARWVEAVEIVGSM
jgi:hypothetical protein